MYSFCEFQGRRGDSATRSLTEWRCQMRGFSTVEIETGILHVRHLYNSVKRGTFGVISALWVTELLRKQKQEL